MSARTLLALLAAVLSLTAVAAGPVPATTFDATTATFASVLGSAAHGDIIALTSGNYGTFTGTDKAVTIQAAPGANAVMQFDFDTGAQAFTIDGITGAGGRIATGARDITIRNTSFSSDLEIHGLAHSNVLLDQDQFLNIDAPAGGAPARLWLSYGCSTASGVTVQRSLFAGGDSDGVQTGCAMTVQDNEFRDIVEHTGTTNHTDSIQCGGGCQGGLTIRRNWVHQTTPAVTQGITAYDRVQDALVEDNVVDILRTESIEWYSDANSIIRHNTLVYHPPGCGSPSLPCGTIYLDHKGGDPAGVGTVVADNIATDISLVSGSTVATEDYNLLRTPGSGPHDITGGPTFVGGTTPTTLAGFALGTGSLGKGAAADGSDLGARVTTPPTTPDTTIDSGPASSTTSTSATFAFHADVGSSTFQCSLDGGAYATCSSTKSFSGLALGAHAYSVRAIGPSGLVDPSAATSKWTITSPTGPTYIGETETAWSTTTPKTTASISVQSGDVLVAYGLTEDQANALSISGGSLTWTQQQLVNVSNYGRAYVWTATASSTGSITVTFTRSSGTGQFGGDVLLFRGSSGGVGASAKTNTTGAPSLSLTTTQAHSAVVVASVDWNAIDGSSRTWRVGAGPLTETTYARSSGIFTVYGGVHPDAGVAGAKTLGLSAPSGQQYSTVAVEVKP
jgi:hypothetical protein